VASAELALDKEADSSGLRVKAEANFGAYLSMFAPSIPTTGLAKVISGLYRIPAIRIDFDCAFTNTVPVDAIRGAGKPEALFLLERLVDLRRARNRPHAGRAAPAEPAQAADMPYKAATGYTYDAADCPRCSRRRCEPPTSRASRRAVPPARPRAERGLGYPATCTAPAASPTSTSWSGRARPAGASVGTQSQGQGHETVFAQILSAALGVPVETHRGAPGRHAHHPAWRRHRRLVLDHHQRHDSAGAPPTS
jgi:carbon-monoxide dehydrogenase large subunit